MAEFFTDFIKKLKPFFAPRNTHVFLPNLILATPVVDSVETYLKNLPSTDLHQQLIQNKVKPTETCYFDLSAVNHANFHQVVRLFFGATSFQEIKAMCIKNADGFTDAGNKKKLTF